MPAAVVNAQQRRTARPGTFHALASVAGVTTVGVCPVFLVGGLGVQLQAALGFGAAGLGMATAGFFGVAALASRIMGWLVERIGAPNGMRLSAVCSSLLLVGLSVINDAVWLLGLLLLAGMSTALAQPSSNLLITQAVPTHRRGTGFGVKQSAIPMATMLAGAAVPAVALTIGWRWVFVFGGLLGLIAAWSVPSLPATQQPARSAPSKSSPGQRRAMLLIIAATGGLGSAAANSLGAFLTTTAVDVGFSPWAAGLVLSLGSIVGLSVRLAAGVLADRRNPNLLRVILVMLFLGAVGFALMAIPAQLPFILGVLIAFGAGWAWPGLLNFAVAKIAPDRVASATSFTQTGVYVGACLGPLLFGVVAQHSGLSVAWGAASAAAVIAGTLLFFIRR